MHSLTIFSKSKNIIGQSITSLGIVMLLLISGCAKELPDENEQGDDITLATKIKREASFERVNNLAQTVEWDDGRLQINGFNGRGAIAITNAATGQFVGSNRFDDDDDNRSRNFVVNNVTAIPCSVRVQVGSQVQVIPVQNAPANCIGITAATGSGLHIDDADWRASVNKLTVRGAGALPRELVSVFDAVTGQLLGTDQANAIGVWKVKARNLFAAPCLVSVVSANQVVQANVDNAPLGCGNIPVFNNPGGVNTFNQAPDGVIVGPIADMAINVGSSVNFMGSGFDPDSNATLSYRWDFDGAAPDSFQQNQNVIFTTAGVYRVTLSVTDSLGLIDPTPDTRVIVVQPNIFNNQAPSGQIASPQTNVEINAGQSVYFSGTGFDPEGTQLQYVWNFAGGAVNSTQATPGNVYFSTPGVYLVSLTVIDATGFADPTPQVVAVTVRGGNTGLPQPGFPFPGLPNNPTNIAPDGEIISPASDTNIAVGQSINFMATAFDPDSIGGNGLRYRWDFGGLAPVSTQLNPGPITFNTPGVYIVMFTVTDALGMVDPTPSVRTIVVGGNGTGNGNGGGFGQGLNGLITFPTNNQTINVGQSITFSGSGFNANNPNALITYNWDFGGAAASSTLQNPGAVIFNQPGTYTVTLTVRDAQGNQDFTPDTRIITVLGNGTANPGGNFVNQAPESQIISPATDVVINIGDSVDFAGFGTDPENNSPLIYSWDFDEAAPEMLVQNPGRQIFSRAGSYRVRLTVIDANGNVDPTPAVRMITVRNPLVFNTEPSGTITSPATSMTVNAGEFVNFSGFGSDPDGNGLLTYEWDFGGAAPTSSLQNPGSVQFNKAGIVKVTLYVKDAQGYYDSTPDVRFITVQGTSNGNQAPEAVIISPATDLEVNVGDTISFIGAGQDLDNFGANLTYMWNFGGLLPSSSLAAPGPMTFNTPGTYTVSLTVMDNFGQSDMTPATRTIVVKDSSFTNRAPIVSLLSPTQSLSNISVGQTLSFSASGTDQDNDFLTYEWNFDGAAADSNLQNPGVITFNTPGTYQVSVVAVDSRGQRSTPTTVTVTVQGFGQIPSQQAPDSTIVSPATNMTVSVGETINFQGQGTDFDANLPLTYRWNFNGAAASSYTQNPGNVTFNKVGTYQVKLTVADSTGATDLTPATRTITVVSQSGNGFPNNPGNGSGIGQRPIVNISSPFSQTTNINIGASVNFSATATDPDNNLPLSYRWTFGNGMPDQFVQNPGNVVFNQAGTYIVTLTVTDSLGNIGTATRTIIVGNGSFPGNGGTGTGAPNGIINAPANDITISRGQSIYFSGDAIDPDGDFNITYSWNFGGGAVASTQKIPGNVIFSTQGRFTVTLTVTDSTGQVDQTPAIVTVTVL